MSWLYVTEQGATIRKRGESLVVEKDGATLGEVECHRLRGVILYGAVAITTPALHALLDRGIECALLAADGRLRGQLTPPVGKNIDLRLAQYRAFRDPAASLALARELVAAKIRNGLELLKQADWNSADVATRTAREELERRLAGVAAAPSFDVLLGIEGAASRAYFSAFAALLKAPGMPFEGRRRRPPPDPVNALLSFCYALLASLIQAQLDAMGWDPYLGFFHQPAYGRPSLALDLLEPLRAPLADRFVVRTVNLRIFQPHDFEPDADRGGVRLRPDRVRDFFRRWHEWLGREKLTEIVDAQARALARRIEGTATEPAGFFQWRAR